MLSRVDISLHSCFHMITIAHEGCGKTLLHITMIIYWMCTNRCVKDILYMTYAIIPGKTDLFAHCIHRCSSHWSVIIYQYSVLECLWNDSHAISALINLNEQLICYSSGLISRASLTCSSAVNGQNTSSNCSLQCLKRRKEELSVLSVMKLFGFNLYTLLELIALQTIHVVVGE